MRLFLSFIFICYLPIAWAGSSLMVPDAFNVLAVNGQEYSTGLFANNEKLDLPVGISQIVLEYNELFEIDADDHEIISSDPFKVELRLEEGDFKIEYSRPENVEKAKLFAKAPYVSVVNNATKRPAEITVEQLPTVSNGITDFFISDKPEPFERLTFWWQKASESEREQFKAWLIQNK